VSVHHKPVQFETNEHRNIIGFAPNLSAAIHLAVPKARSDIAYFSALILYYVLPLCPFPYLLYTVAMPLYQQLFGTPFLSASLYFSKRGAY